MDHASLVAAGRIGQFLAFSYVVSMTVPYTRKSLFVGGNVSQARHAINRNT